MSCTSKSIYNSRFPVRFMSVISSVCRKNGTKILGKIMFSKGVSSYIIGAVLAATRKKRVAASSDQLDSGWISSI